MNVTGNGSGEKIEEFESMRDAINSLMRYAIDEGSASEVFGALLHNLAWFVSVTKDPAKTEQMALEAISKLVPAYLVDRGDKGVLH